MPTYHYECDACDRKEDIEQPMGSTKEHPCTECEGTCKRVLKPVKEMTAAGKGTPGSQAERSAEHRAVDTALTHIRKTRGLGPNTEGDQLAADRHWGKKNGIV